MIEALRQREIYAVFHYVPLHSSPAGKRYGRTHGTLENTVRESEQLIRLPLWIGLTEVEQQAVVEGLTHAIEQASVKA